MKSVSVTMPLMERSDNVLATRWSRNNVGMKVVKSWAGREWGVKSGIT
jgi:hypothetical protein